MRGNLVYAYAALRTLAAWKPATFTVTLDGGEPVEHAATRWRSRTTRPSAAACSSRRTPSSTTARFDVVLSGTVGKCRFLANLPKVFKGTHVENPEVTVSRASTVEVSADRPFAGLLPTASTSRDLPGELRRPAPAPCG